MSGNLVSSIKIRMYNTGSVGDCFLLLFQKNGTTSFSMMIDCGGIKTTAAMVAPCVQDIMNNCNGKLDLLLATHQHEDHLSGFNLARSLFDQIKVGEVWMSWVEDETDVLGQKVKEKYGKKIKQLRSSLAAWAISAKTPVPASAGKAMKDRRDLIRSNIAQSIKLLQFEAGEDHHSNLAAGSRTNDDAMQYLKKKGKQMIYRKPGEIIQMPGAEGIKMYVLGPPRDEDLKFLKIETNPDEMYHLALSASSNNEETQTTLLSEVESLLVDHKSPFAKEFKLIGPELNSAEKIYHSTNMKWRQIEEDWKESASDMALALTRLTNNTSLAIALEFTESKQVILLPADAQSGNWMSWHKPDINAAFKNKGGRDIKELLQDTVFYKVGHHSSHNGTASLSGLELMNASNLVAFIPLIQNKVPSAWGGAKNFPASKLYDHLIQKTKGRLIRTDQGIVTNATAVNLRNNLSNADKQSFKNQFKEGDCYFEYTING